MIKRFSLYGFLKNLRFFEPFFLLFLMEKGLSFLEIGFLFSFREICINLMEIPSGALADLYGRKNVMLLSLGSYIVSFILFGINMPVWFLYVAMFFFSIGEAFRTGTHKAMVFDYLRHEKMVDRKTEVYGYTRSWAQIGSALSVLLAGGLVFYTGKYAYVFWFSIIPYLLGLWNMSYYPSWLNRTGDQKIGLKSVFRHLWKVAGSIFKSECDLRHLIVKSVIYSGQFKALKDYLQAIIRAQVVLIPVALSLADEKRTAILVAIVYFILYLLNSYSSKKAHKFLYMFKKKETATTLIIIFSVIVLLASALGTYKGIYLIAIIGFVFLFNLQNIWKPILLAQFDDCAKGEEQATIFSVESQAVSIGVAVIAPLVGWSADNFGLYSVFLICSFFMILYLVASGIYFTLVKKR